MTWKFIAFCTILLKEFSSFARGPSCVVRVIKFWPLNIFDERCRVVRWNFRHECSLIRGSEIISSMGCCVSSLRTRLWNLLTAFFVLCKLKATEAYQQAFLRITYCWSSFKQWASIRSSYLASDIEWIKCIQKRLKWPVSRGSSMSLPIRISYQHNYFWSKTSWMSKLQVD